MLLKSDIEWIKRNREEVIKNRIEEIVLYRKTKIGEDPFTGDATYATTEQRVYGTWLAYTSETYGTDDRKIVAGAVAEVGDAFAEFDMSVDLSNVEKVSHVPTGESWKIKGVDLVGIGEPNRKYVLLGKVH